MTRSHTQSSAEVQRTGKDDSGGEEGGRTQTPHAAASSAPAPPRRHRVGFSVRVDLVVRWRCLKVCERAAHAAVHGASMCVRVCAGDPGETQGTSGRVVSLFVCAVALFTQALLHLLLRRAHCGLAHHHHDDDAKVPRPESCRGGSASGRPGARPAGAPSHLAASRPNPAAAAAGRSTRHARTTSPHLYPVDPQLCRVRLGRRPLSGPPGTLAHLVPPARPTNPGRRTRRVHCRRPRGHPVVGRLLCERRLGKVPSRPKRRRCGPASSRSSVHVPLLARDAEDDDMSDAPYHSLPRPGGGGPGRSSGGLLDGLLHSRLRLHPLALVPALMVGAVLALSGVFGPTMGTSRSNMVVVRLAPAPPPPT